jgi:transposase-like protein
MATEKENPTLSTEKINEDIEEISITVLPAKMQRFVQLYMTGQYTLNKLAELLEVHPNTLGKWLKRNDVKTIITQMQKTTHEMVATHLNALTLKAVNKLGQLIESPIDGVALQAVNSTLDRGGHRPEQKIKVDKTVKTYEQKLKDVIDKVIDVDYEEVEVEG